MEAALPCHAELAAHAAARLAGNAQSGAVAVGNEDGLDVASAYAFKEVFGGSVGAYGLSFGGFAPHGVFRRQFAASLLGEVGHSLDGIDALLIEPCSHLSGGKAPQAYFGSNLPQFLESQPKQFLHQSKFWAIAFMARYAGTPRYSIEYTPSSIGIATLKCWFMSWIHLVP